MKKSALLTLVLFIGIFALSSCKSKEDKAAELIKKELSKTLYDFNSYEPIETTVKEATSNAYNDTTCFRLAMVIAYTMDKASKAFDEAKDAQEHMEIWGAPTYYSSSYSDRQYYKYKDEAKDKYAEGMAAYVMVKALGSNLEDSIAALDKEKVLGWEVNHRFRCKTRGGQSTIGDYRYIIDKDFKTIIFQEDMDNNDYSKARDIIKEAIEGSFSKMNID